MRFPPTRGLGQASGGHPLIHKLRHGLWRACLGCFCWVFFLFCLGDPVVARGGGSRTLSLLLLPDRFLFALRQGDEGFGAVLVDDGFKVVVVYSGRQRRDGGECWVTRCCGSWGL